MTVVVPVGRLDFAASTAFQAEVERVLAAGGPGALLLDCAGLDYVSSAGLRVFLIAAKGCQRGGRVLALCALQPAVREVFDLSGFSRLFAIHPDRAAALAASGMA
ncbi:MAG: STAS domain-containing protein [Proteobacteria bacterium]|nr:STAS domain-containing protein [Pseudomonadota bacterium]